MGVMKRMMLIAASGLFCLPALALPTIGAQAPAFEVKDGDDSVLDSASLKGKKLVIFYETRDDSVIEQNRAVKRKMLEHLRQDSTLAAQTVIVPIIDCSSAFALTRGIWKSNLRANSEKEGLTIYCDWDGSVGRAFQVQADQSNVIVIGRDGLVKFAAGGVVKPNEVDRALSDSP